MTGHIKRTHIVIRQNFLKALYVYCASHSFNQAVSTAFDAQSVRNCLGVVKKMYYVFNTPKQKNFLLNEIDDCDLDPKQSLSSVCVPLYRWNNI